MKYSNLIFLLIIFNHYALECLNSYGYLNAIQKTFFSYKNKCRIINIIQAIKHSSTLTKALISPQSYEEIKKELIKKRLILKNHYLTQEKKIFRKLGKSLGFSQTEWSDCLQTISNIKVITTQQPEEKIVHDSTIPKDLLSLTKNLLIKNNINPASINFIFDTTDSKEVFASTTSDFYYIYCPENAQFIQNPHTIQKITFYEHITNETKSNQLAICAHEVEHLCQQHGITKIIIQEYLQHYHHEGDTILEHNKQWQKLKIIHEKQAEIFSALKSPTIAKAMVSCRMKTYYPDYLYEAHYHDLVEINNLWKVEKIIENLDHFYKKRFPFSYLS
jgi:hypothetical protein